MRSEAQVDALWRQVADQVIMEEICLKLAAIRQEREQQDDPWPTLEEMYRDLRDAENAGDYDKANKIEVAIDGLTREKEGHGSE